MSEPSFLLDSYKTIFNYILDPIVVYQVDDQYRFQKMMMINESFHESYGYGLKEVLKADFSLINANPHQVPDLIESICKTGNILFETVHRNKAGEEFPVEVHSQCVKGKGNPVVVSIIRNITERKRAQSELFDLQEIRSRTVKMMSHDLRNSLAQMSGALLLLKEHSFEQSVQELIDILGEAHYNANRLLVEHLGTTKEPGDSLRLDILPFDLANLVSRLYRKYSVLAQTEKAIELITEFPEISTLVEGDQFKLTRVLDNVMGNAVKFSERGSNILFIVVIEERQVRFSIRDQGIGIPDHLHDSIFYADADSGRPGTEGEPSNGLGLYIARRIVDMHQGKIWFETQEGIGTTFHVEIPRKLNS